MKKVDAVLHTNNSNTIPDEFQQGEPLLVNGNARLHYVRVTTSKLTALAEHYTVLAQSPYTGMGTADRVYAQIQESGDKIALYRSVYNLDPVARMDEDGNEYVTQPPFKFGMLAESALPVPESVTSRQGMEQLIRSGLDEQVDSAINGITDPVERKLARNWLDKAGIWERNNPQLLAIGNALGLTSADVDALFIEASGL